MTKDGQQPPGPWPSLNNGAESGVNRTSAVGGFPGGAADWWRALQPDSEAVHDLTGNVWEWTASLYTEDYAGARQSVLNANAGDGPRVLRGGSWSHGPFTRYFHFSFFGGASCRPRLELTQF